MQFLFNHAFLKAYKFWLFLASVLYRLLHILLYFAPENDCYYRPFCCFPTPYIHTLTKNNTLKINKLKKQTREKNLCNHKYLC